MRLSNERLEYLGDAVLGAVVAEMLFKKFPYREEGFLTEMRAKIVNREHLNKLGLKLGLDQRVSGNPHCGPPTMLAKPRCEQARALDVEDDLAARMVRQDILREQHVLSVRVNDLTILGHHTSAIAIAIEREADFGIGLAQAANQIFEVFGVRRIGMMIWKRAIDIAEELDDLVT